MLHSSFVQKLPTVIDILKKYKIVRAYAFGSVCNEKFNPTSDIDLLISFQENIDPLEKGQNLWDLEDELEMVLNPEIDLVTDTSLKNPYFIKELNETKIRLYEYQ